MERYFLLSMGESVLSAARCKADNSDGIAALISVGYAEVIKDVFDAAPWPAQKPVIDPPTETQLAVAELAQVVEDNNTANQLAIAELAGIILGG